MTLAARLALAVGLLLAAAAHAQQPEPETEPDQSAPDQAGETADPAESDDTDEPAVSDERVLAITNATINPVAGPLRRGVTILCRDGKIDAIGRDLDIPDHAEVIDAAGYRVYPGLVAVDSSGLVASEPADATDPYDLSMTLGLAAGITTAVSGNSAAKLSFGTLEDHALASDVFETIRYSSADPQARRRVREGLERVRGYLRVLEAHERRKADDPEAEPPDDAVIKGRNAPYHRLLTDEATALATAIEADDIVALAELAQHFGFRLVIRRADEGWTVAHRLGAGDVSAIVTPRTRRFADERLNRPNGASIENAATLVAAGVPVAVIPSGTGISLGGLAGRDLLNLNMEAAFAVRGGLSDAQAVRALTLDAARVIGQDHRIGSIEIGKDADLVIADGPLLHYQTLARYTIVNGRIAYDREQESLLSHIRPGGDPDAPPPNDYWPRRLGWPQQFP